MSHIAFIGLGNMGSPMAHNLLKAGHELTVFDLVPAAVQGLVDAGARSAASADACVQNAEVIITMLPASRHVEGLYLGDDGLLGERGTRHRKQSDCRSRGEKLSFHLLLLWASLGAPNGQEEMMFQAFAGTAITFSRQPAAQIH